MIIRNSQWSNLPRDILLQVANRLGLIDLIKFRLVCKGFLSASCTATAKIEYFPWFLFYGGQDSRCSLLSYGDNCTKTYTLNLPQLQGATCLASSQGWLLVFREGSIFFYCPFSDVRIDLPNLPKAKLTSDHTAAFSSPPWSKDCVITVIRRYLKTYIELNVLKLGDNWVTHDIKYEGSLNNIKGSAYHGGTFYFLDNCRQGITYCPKTNLVTTYFDGRNKEIVFSLDKHQVTTYLHYPHSFEVR
ncbi:hypothetical protein FNV43_RR26363 [Rhamnella rubrinervis]|uniref:F-box domain-containing protein n=1 Tax=Rhamnella rubrinervis TaxID=2594499 RepID=A0A8K0DUU8_9ROSA|nr:hypothetical protein FNV43_RR26363 [Rhamnella rubrinervis]